MVNEFNLYPVFVRQSEDDSWYATCRDLPNFSARGTRLNPYEEAIADALYWHIERLRENGEAIPEPSVDTMTVEIRISPRPYDLPIYREIMSHRGDSLNDKLTVVALEDRNECGAVTKYSIEFPISVSAKGKPLNRTCLNISFQSRDPDTEGVDGVTNEALLAVLIDRLEVFQEGDHASVYNSEALTYLRLAMNVLKNRSAAAAKKRQEPTEIA